MIDWKKIEDRLTAICDHYEKTAPNVAEWANDLYVRLNEEPDTVVITELSMAERLYEDGVWMHPNYAANVVYKLLYRLQRDTAGMAGF